MIFPNLYGRRGMKLSPLKFVHTVIEIEHAHTHTDNKAKPKKTVPLLRQHI